jgi:hypothetical protein
MILLLHCILASRYCLFSIDIYFFVCFGFVVIKQQKGGDCKKNEPYGPLSLILVFDDQHDHLD